MNAPAIAGPVRAKTWSSEEKEIIRLVDGKQQLVCMAMLNADAAFVASAFNVYAETGKTPRQLQEENLLLRMKISRLESGS